MDERLSEKIKKYLQDTDAQERIQQSIQRGRLEATVKIGRVAQLFNLKESKLRDWEVRGLLTPLRFKENTGQRQYTPNELEKLAIIKELIDEGGYAPSDIPKNVYDIWKSISGLNGQKEAVTDSRELQINDSREVDRLPIDQRVEHVYFKELFWRYYASRALWLTLMLICEDIPNTIAGLVMPLRTNNVPVSLRNPENLYKIGDALVGWLGQSRSFYTLLTSAPSFEHPSDFRILPLQVIEENTPMEGTPKDPTLIVIQRKVILTLSQTVVDVVRRLLEPLYYEVPDWHLFFGQGMRDLLDPVSDFNSGTIHSDTILTGIAERVVRMGGQNNEGQNRWRFCCILVPNNSQLPLQQRSLVVRAKSKSAPYEYKVGTTIVTPDKAIISISLRAFQGGRVSYRHMVTPEDLSIANRDKEEPICSAIAVPVGGEDGMPVAVIYVVSSESEAFSEEDQRLLRMLGRMVEELLLTYEVRTRVVEQFNNLINNPSTVDPSFEAFDSENEFIRDVEILLATIEEKEVEEITDREKDYTTKEALSFIAIDIDNLSNVTNKYGDRLTKNLSRAVGLKLQNLLHTLFTSPTDCKLYHIYADRFYLLLNSISLEEARVKANLLKRDLNDSYHINALRFSVEQPKLESKLEVPDITVRLAVSSYTYHKLRNLMKRHPYQSRFAALVSDIKKSLDEMLKTGLDKGGNVIISWEPSIWGHALWEPPKLDL